MALRHVCIVNSEVQRVQIGVAVHSTSSYACGFSHICNTAACLNPHSTIDHSTAQHFETMLDIKHVTPSCSIQIKPLRSKAMIHTSLLCR